jgi:predicted dehydrogenase/threonine dehydrogenase-like Zn-dependent dehydrogenase
LKQILQNLSSGETVVAEVPEPQPAPGAVVIKSSCSLVSAGTERMLVDFGRANLIDKARSQPDKVKEVLQKVRSDGIVPTLEAVRAKLDQPLPLGYCNVGMVVGGGGTFKPGQRVASNGPHAGTVRVPVNLCAVIPDNVDDESAAFTVLGAIALQGVRLSQPTLGECFVVMGLGLVGLLTVQILIANGCRVLAIDIDPNRCAKAAEYGADVVDLSSGVNAVSEAVAMSRSRGVDGVIITASSKSNDLIHDAATMCRKRGRIVLVGVVGMELSRADFYEKELSFQVSCSYGPGRYESNFEEKGLDYPVGFVRWTEQRNFEAVLDLMSSGALEVKSLITDRFDISDGSAAYAKLDDKQSLGILLDYTKTNSPDSPKATVALNERPIGISSAGNVAFIGGGNYASRVLIPAFKRAGANLTSLVTSGGLNAVHHGTKFGFAIASTDEEQAFDSNTDTVVICTQHNLHARQVISAIEKHKHVFVEKPLALNHNDIDAIEAMQRAANCILMVGYNRRFSPQVKRVKALLDKKATPKTFIMTMNAGEIPADHWTQDPDVGGGRIIGEACHYIDLMRFLVGSKIKSFSAIKMGDSSYVEVTEDKAIITLSFEDGSVGSIHYFANGSKSFPKERIEVFCDGGVLQLDNFRTLKGFGWKGFNKMNLWSQDKGQEACSKAFMDAVKEGGESPIPQDEIFEVARVAVDVAEELRK